MATTYKCPKCGKGLDEVETGGEDSNGDGIVVYVCTNPKCDYKE